MNKNCIEGAAKQGERAIYREALVIKAKWRRCSGCALVAEGKLTDAAYTSPAGPIAPLDILYGHRPQMAQGNLFMAHRCGFTQKVLDGTLRSCGFQMVASMARGRTPFLDLWAVASKSTRSEDAMRALAGEHFPR